jgi:hypothetical protein
MITANYPERPRKVAVIMEIATICPVSGGEFSPGDEFPVQVTAKSPSSENSP